VREGMTSRIGIIGAAYGLRASVYRPRWYITNV
jgi:hypothetical protein